MRVLVTGGAGYLGSHTVVQLVEAGHEPVIVDNFGNAPYSVIGRLEQLTGRGIETHRVDLRDGPALRRLFDSAGPFDAVIHFAGLKAVGASVEQPLVYYENNVVGTLRLLEEMGRHGTSTLVFSSSATVYGRTAQSLLTEDLPTAATNPYGWSKVMCEQILHDIAATNNDWRIAILRYFNPTGAHPSGLIGEGPLGEATNLMPVLAEVAAGRRERLEIFGGNYPTDDGTAVRDYVHVMDLAAGHIAALEHLAVGDTALRTWNLGTGQGTSVLELVRAFERATGRPMPYEIAPRRAGDVAVSVACVERAQAELGWRAARTIDDMCADAWRWQSSTFATESI